MFESSYFAVILFIGFCGSTYQIGSVTVFPLSVNKSGFETLMFPAPLSSQTVQNNQNWAF